MKIQEQDIYHGPALMQIVEHESFKALNRVDKKYGHYLVNTDVKLWFKYSTNDGTVWTFTFQLGDLVALKEDLALKGATHVVLACGHHSICCLSAEEVSKLIDTEASEPQWVKIEAPPKRQMRVTGSLSKKNATLVPHNKFPNCIF